MNLNKVIIIDDDPLFLGVAEALMRSLGAASVYCHARPNEALSQILRAPEDVDLILCDLNMPGMDGIGFVRALGERDFAGPLILVSSEAEAVIKSVRAIGEMVGVNIVGGLKKPLRQATLSEMIQKAEAKAREQTTHAMSEKALRNALTEGRVVPVYQPQLNLSEMVFDGVEVLCRLQSLDGRLMSPAPLLAAAETYDLMSPLTFYLLRRSLHDLKPWLTESARNICSLNISPLTLRDRSLPRILIDSVARMGVETRQITLEVTEDHLLSFGPDTLEVLARLRIAGFGLSIDDFGTVATSLEQLKRFPFTELKIDRAFVQNNGSDAFAHEVLTASARLASIVGLTSVAEGVETPDDLEQVAAAKINRVQGFLLARPMAIEDFEAWRRAPKELGAVA
ncbi:MAG: EAL domain-containing response regulator [Pseudomonadota bacterium]